MTARRWSVIAGLVLIVLVAWWFLHWQATRVVGDLAERTREDLIIVDGGTFEAGNFEVDVALPEGAVERRFVSASALPPYPATVERFAMLAHEPTNADFALFAAATGRPDVVEGSEPDQAAAMTWQEATAYCDWLGGVVGLPMRLPSEVEWEFAARSRGALVPWPTSDGMYRPGANLAGPGTLEEAASIWPPSPMGFHDMAEGLREWVSDVGPDDSRISKGGSLRSDSFYETIPGRTVAEPITEMMPFLSDETVASSGGFPLHTGNATARCAVSGGDLPVGIGRTPDLSGVSFPEVVGPYDARGNLLNG